MKSPVNTDSVRSAPIDMSADQFKQIGHQLVDQIAELLESLPDRPVTRSTDAPTIRTLINSSRSLPENGANPAKLINDISHTLIDHSLYNGHPGFWGYITAGATPIGVLADFLAAAVNPNCGAWKLSPVAAEIESQSIRWIADLIGYPTNCGGIFVSGGNMANFVGFLSARAAKAKWDIRKNGLGDTGAHKMITYCSAETHTWVQKAADLFGLGTNTIRWIPVDNNLQMDLTILRKTIDTDRKAGNQQFLVVGTAGSVSTGAVDPLYDIAKICRDENLWFHVDGAYGGFAANASLAPKELAGLSEADSVAIDPHKWLYMPLEIGCALVRDPKAMTDAFSYHPPYYHFDREVINFVDYGLQNSRGFRALKVWLALQQVGRSGYLKMIDDDIALSQEMFSALSKEPEIETLTQYLSIATFRYLPADLKSRTDETPVAEYLNKLNEQIMLGIERSGEAFVSVAMISGKFALRACMVNFRTTRADILKFPSLVSRIGRQTDIGMRSSLNH